MLRDLAIISFITIVGFVITGEVLVRCLKKEEIEMVVASSNPKLVTELNKNYKGINSYGMRDYEFNLADMKDRYKIAVIGDSHAYSLKVDNIEETFPSRLEQYLNQSLGPKAVKVFNFGVTSYNAAQELEVLETKVPVFQPKLIILQYTINDTHVCNYIQPAHKKLNALIHKSKLFVRIYKRILYSSFGEKYLYDWVGQHFPDGLLYQEGLVGTRKAAPDEVKEHKRHPPRTKDRVPARYHYMLGEEQWKKHIQIFAYLCKQNNIPVVATGVMGPQEEDFFLKEGFDVFSFNEIFENKDMKDYGYNPDNTADHFDAKGSDFIGKALADYIQTHYLVMRAH